MELSTSSTESMISGPTPSPGIIVHLILSPLFFVALAHDPRTLARFPSTVTTSAAGAEVCRERNEFEFAAMVAARFRVEGEAAAKRCLVPIREMIDDMMMAVLVSSATVVL